MGFAIVALLMGFLIKNKDIKYTFYTYSIIFIICVLIVRSIKFKGKSSSHRVKIEDLKQLMKNKIFIIFIASVTVTNIAL
ncbi:MFS transporter [Clostridium sp. DJ247]|nr:MFS transporter [Clostridium sp. DJ247]